MRTPATIPLIVVTAAVALLPLASFDPQTTPTEPPRGYDREAVTLDAVFRVEIGYDAQVAARHGAAIDVLLTEALAIHNTAWRQYRRERFELGGVRFVDSGKERDATYVLSRFLLQTTEAPQTIHIHLVGRSVEVYTSRGRKQVRGLAFRGSDTLLVKMTPNVAPDVLAYSLFHEIGHLWGTYDLPFPGGNSTFGSKSGGYSFDVDAGNVEILAASSGPAPRDVPNRGPAVIRRKLDQVRQLTENVSLRARLQEVVLHEPSAANPGYVYKKKTILASAGKDRPRLRKFFAQLESTPAHRRQDARTRQRIAHHYWRANDLIARADYVGAQREIRAIQAIDAGSTDVHLLIGAMDKKIRNGR